MQLRKLAILFMLATSCAQEESSDTKAVGNYKSVWPSTNIAYQIDPSIPASMHAAIRTGVAMWNNNTVIKLNENPGATPRIRFVFNKEGSSFSYVGYQGKSVQDVNLADWATAGTVAHEVGHALGMEHEHTRLDRDNFVINKYENIIQSSKHNFDISSNAIDLGQYDFDSIMHYPAHSFPIDPSKPTIIRKDNGVVLGQRAALSVGDRLGMASLYSRIHPDVATSSDWASNSRSAHNFCRAAGFTSGTLDGNTYPYATRGRVFGVICHDNSHVTHFPNTGVGYNGNYMESQLPAHDFCAANGHTTGYFDGNTAIVNGSRVWGISCVKSATRVLTSFKSKLNPHAPAESSQKLQRFAWEECRNRGFVTGLPEGNWIGDQDIFAIQCFGGVYHEAFSGILN